MNPPTVHQIKVTIEGTAPSVWRRFQAQSDIRLGRLHRVLQAVMGWEDSHLYLFRADGVMYGEPGVIEGTRLRSVKMTTLGDIAPAVGTEFVYEYDFGDDWQHVLRVEQIVPCDEDTEYPVCLAGERACPPEDCGGVPGYEELLEALQDRRHPDHVRMRNWLGGEFDPEVYDLAAVNSALRRVR